MIAACPKCASRYRIAREKIKPDGVRLRCTQCEVIFRVRAPESAPRRPSPAEAPQPAAPAAAEAPRPRAPSLATPPADSSSRDAGGAAPLVLVAIPDEDLAKQTAEALRGWGPRSATVHDGVEAMLEIQRQLPTAVVLSATLPRMYGFQICEMVKRNESLRSTLVVLAGAIHHRERYRRTPGDLYGADAYLEEPDLPGALRPILERKGLVDPLPSIPTQPARPVSGSDPVKGGVPEPAHAVRRPTPDPAPKAVRPDALPRLGQPPLAASSALPPLGDSRDPGLPDDAAVQPFGGPEAPAVPLRPPPGPEGPSVGSPAEPVRPSVGLPPEPERVARPVPPASPARPVPPVDDGLGEERARAERLARIIVSDIVLYNEEKFAEAVANGNVAEAMMAELDEGRGLFCQRVDERIRVGTDHLTEELLRVARARGGA